LGLIIFGIGEALLVAAGIGVSPWIVLSEGIALFSGWSIGFSTFIISVAVLLFWIPLAQTPGLGTLLNVLVIAMMLELALPYLPQPEQFHWQMAEAVAGVTLVGLGSGLYLMANLGPGPRDGLMTGLQRISQRSIAVVRTSIEVVVVVLGWLLGGTVGIGTLLFAFGIGPAVAVGLYTVNRLSRK